MQTVLVFLCAALALAAAAPSPLATCPTILTREQWGGRPPLSQYPLPTPTDYVIMHHAESEACTTQDECSAIIRAFQKTDMDDFQPDINFNFFIGEDGNAYEGRGWDATGWHSMGYDAVAIGICFIGNFTTNMPNALAMTAAKQLIACGVTLNKVSADHQLAAHRQMFTLPAPCPGDALYADIQTWPNWSSRP